MSYQYPTNNDGGTRAYHPRALVASDVTAAVNPANDDDASTTTDAR